MSKCNLSCTTQNIQHIAMFGLLEIFYLLEVKIKTKILHKMNITGKSQHRQQQCKVLKQCFKKNLQKLIEV